MFTIWKCFAAILTIDFAFQAAAAPQLSRSYRYLPGDPEWPSDQDWAILNQTVGGKLIRGVPLAQSCYGTEVNETECLKIRDVWAEILPL
jgi:hypothetical protein